MKVSSWNRDRFFDLSLDLLCVAGFDGYFKAVNPAWATALGWSLDELTAKPWLDFVHPEDRDETAAEGAKLFEGRISVSFENRYRTKHGSYRRLQWNAFPVPDERMIYAAARDVTEQRSLEEQMKRLESELAQQAIRGLEHERDAMRARLSGIIESAMDAIITVDEDQRIVLFNKAAETLFQTPAGEAIGTSLDRLIPPRYRSDHAQHVQRFGTTGVTNRAMGRLSAISGLRANGEEFPIEASISQVDSGGRKFYTVILRDVTERTRAEEEIHRLQAGLERRVEERTRALASINQELEAFSYSVSHDLRAPLRGIDGFTRIILEKYADRLDQEGREYLQRVCASAARMGTLIDDLLALSRLSRVDMRAQSVDLAALAQEVLGELRLREPGRHIEAVIPASLHAWGDARLIRIVLENLLGNAWKFTGRRPQGRIALDAETRDGQTVYRVQDNGAGFDMAYVGQLFGAFQRLHTLDEFPGTGIGLATVQRIIHRHGGRLWAEGAVDQGATFYFTLGTPPAGGNAHDSTDRLIGRG